MSKIILEFRGAHVPSFKNSKIWTGKKLITKPAYQAIMAAMVESFASQCMSFAQTIDNGTSMALSPQSWTAFRLPSNDCRQVISELGPTTCEQVEEGHEGCIVTIERIS